MIDTKKIFRDFIQNDEALDAEVTSSGVMLSEEDCLTLMDRVVSNRRELLIDFADNINIHDGDRDKIGKLVDIYLKINSPVVPKQSELLLCGFCEVETEHIVYNSGNLQCKKCDWVAKP
jgi:hypothetical protein